MKKLLLVLAAFAALSSGAFAQDREIYEIPLNKEGSGLETSLDFAFPMFFGNSVLTGVNYKGAWDLNSKFLDMQNAKSFAYGLEIASIRFSTGGPLNFSLGARWTFMDFALAHPELTFREVNGTWMPTPITTEGYDKKKSKIHASYIGVPLRVAVNVDKVKFFAGASAEVLVGGYTKYKNPKFRQGAQSMFNKFRATVEAGVAYGAIGLFASYGLTPLFPETLSDTRTLTLGLVLGI